ncbi:hypothetical protein [Suttonella indologenes]|uniref:hypothetical protein n=1 Tax=Suttonella indologenes TaxID=13276 RepID=UPI001559E990|nr:hypothetical protein [Suttonella indologenes]
MARTNSRIGAYDTGNGISVVSAAEFGKASAVNGVSGGSGSAGSASIASSNKDDD